MHTLHLLLIDPQQYRDVSTVSNCWKHPSKVHMDEAKNISTSEDYICSALSYNPYEYSIFVTAICMWLQVVVMIVMFIEALVVLIRRENHFRVTRCLRPIFFIDTYLMAGVRRWYID